MADITVSRPEEIIRDALSVIERKNERLAAEVERLNAKLAEYGSRCWLAVDERRGLREQVENQSKTIGDLRAEVERLKAELDRVNSLRSASTGDPPPLPEWTTT